MKELLREIENTVTADPGNRGMLRHIHGQDVEGAVRLLAGAENILIVTGFPIAACGVGETDGPIGAAAIANAAVSAGKRAGIVTDGYSYDILSACLEAAGQKNVMTYCLEPGQDCRKLCEKISPDLIIAIERPGKGADGHFHNMAGGIIDDMVVDTDAFLDMGIPSIAVGDGGNELGMGNFYDIVSALPFGGGSAAVRKCDAPLVAGISNWWGWGLAAALTALTGRDCMGDEQTQRRMLTAAVERGAVDGVKKQSCLSVDGMEWGGIDEIFSRLKKSAEKYGGSKN